METTIMAFSLRIVVLSLFLISCDHALTDQNNKTPELAKSLDPVEQVQIIKEAENTALKVNFNSKKEAYFSIDFTNITSNPIIDNGLRDAWCIDVFKSIDSNNGIYHNIKLYSTDLVEQWKPVNYLLNIQQALKDNDPLITWLEIQLAIWSLRAYPKFDLYTINLENLPGQFREDGQPLFSYDKVYEILDFVEANYQSFNYDQNGVRFAVVAEMPVDVQTVITITEK